MPRQQLRQPPTSSPARAARVLVVDSDDATRTLYRESLKRENCYVVEAADGREALVSALAHPPSLVITDTRLPHIDGSALCELLRRDPATRCVPIVVVTGDPADGERARALGADCALEKPCSMDKLVSAVKRLCERMSDEPHRPRTAKAGIGSTAAPAQRRRQRQGFETNTPSAVPPQLRCPQCDAQMMYQHSHVGGVSDRYPEQWDYFRCSACRCELEYRQRTRRVRKVG